MKSPAFSQAVDSLDFNLLTRNSVKENFTPVQGRKIRRRVSRRNLAIVTLVYGALLAFLLFLVF